MITCKSITKQFESKNQRVTALKDVSLEIEKGDIFGIIGMSGAGKSTLLKILCLLEKPTYGTICINGEDTAALKGKRLINARKEIGVVFQGYNLLMQRTVFENIAFPLRLEKSGGIKERVEELLKVVGLSDKAEAYPYQLSGGQKQRVAIARALAPKPKILLCDEPTSALDPLSTENILKLLKKINSELNVTIIVVTHEMNVVKSICTQVAVLEDSQIIECGSKKEVVDRPIKSTTKLLLGVRD